MRRTLAVLMTGLAILLGAGTLSRAEEQVANFNLLYDLDATTITYCRVTNANGDPFGQPTRVLLGKLKTSGSSTTVVEQVVGTNPFRDLSVGDIIVANTGVDSTKYGVITAKASDASLTIHSAQNWSNGTSGFNFGYLKQTCGTAATSGWIDLPSQYEDRKVSFLLEQINGVTGGIDMRIECKGGFAGAQPVRVYPTTSSTDCGIGGTTAGGFCNYTAAGITSGRFEVVVAEQQRACRVGLLIHTSETAESVEADNERITVGLTLGEVRK